MKMFKFRKHNTSIRRRLMYAVLLTVGITCLALLYITLLVSIVVGTISNSYKSNSELDAFSTILLEVENSMESYCQYRTFESIDNFYNFRAKLENSLLSFPQAPINSDVGILEYKVNRMTLTFIEYANRSISSKRANDLSSADMHFSKAIESYGFLKQVIAELNNLYFRTNIVRYNAMIEVINKTSRNLVVLVLLIIVLCMLLVYLLITNITKPLLEISEVAHRLAEREFDIPLLKIKSQDEVGNICRAFNLMIISIKEYVDTIWEKAIKENELRENEIKMTALYKDAQLKALQSQINPHFLFNTLNTGAQLAMMEGADKTCYFIEQVADFFRYNIQSCDEKTTLQAELSLVDNFVFIMQVRFGSKFSFEKKINTEKLDIKMPVMILQPLVENCIKHGLYDVANGGIIRLEVGEEILTKDNNQQTSQIVIRISDNGCGFPSELKEQFLHTNLENNILNDNHSESKINESKGIGIYNVVSRLRLFFNRNDVFDIENGIEKIDKEKKVVSYGTSFVIRIYNV